MTEVSLHDASVVRYNCTIIESEIRVRAQAQHIMASRGVALRINRNTKWRQMATVALRTLLRRPCPAPSLP
jgi:hypothetical protein